MNVQVAVGTDLLCLCSAPLKEHPHIPSYQGTENATASSSPSKAAPKQMDGAVSDVTPANQILLAFLIVWDELMDNWCWNCSKVSLVAPCSALCLQWRWQK